MRNQKGITTRKARNRQRKSERGKNGNQRSPGGFLPGLRRTRGRSTQRLSQWINANMQPAKTTNLIAFGSRTKRTRQFQGDNASGAGIKGPRRVRDLRGRELTNRSLRIGRWGTGITGNAGWQENLSSNLIPHYIHCHKLKKGYSKKCIHNLAEPRTNLRITIIPRRSSAPIDPCLHHRGLHCLIHSAHPLPSVAYALVGA